MGKKPTVARVTYADLIRPNSLQRMLKEQRLHLRLTASETARLAEVSQSCYHQIEAGTSAGSPDILWKVAEALDIDPPEVLRLFLRNYLDRYGIPHDRIIDRE